MLRHPSPTILGSLAIFTAAAFACGDDGGSSTFDPAKTNADGGTVNVPPGLGGGDGGTGDPPERCAPCSDFTAPVLDTTAGALPANVADLFGAAPEGAPANGDPCLLEPEPGAVYPRNWLRPRVRFAPTGDADLFEIRFKVKNQTSDLVVYTKAKEWKMDKALWDLLRDHSWDTDITFTVRAGKLDGGALSNVKTSGGSMRVAPVSAQGSIVYWRIIGSEGSELRGFHVGDESVVDVLKPEQVQQKPTGGCVGCHSSSPDGSFVAFGTGDGDHGNSIASIEGATVGQAPPWLGAAGTLMTNKELHTAPAFSAAHWASGDRKVLVTGPIDDPNSDGQERLYSIDLETTDANAARKEIVRTGDPNKPIMPAWSHDGSRVVYVSTTAVYDSRIDGLSDLYSVPYNDGNGGDATPLSGASDVGFEELYPAFSPDDKWLAITRVKADLWGSQHFSNPNSEVSVMPAAGGTPTRLAANDPPACSQKASPGVTNSWSRFSPEVQTFDGKTYYWLVFSSNRTDHHQLYVTPVIVDGSGNVTTGSALYLWNQPADQSNHTPAWDVFKIPSVVN